MTIAMVAAWLLATSGQEPSIHRYVIAARDLPAGHLIGSADLDVIEGEIPDWLINIAFDSPHDLIGSVTEGPIGRGELVQAASIGPTPGDELSHLSFSVDTAWAIAGALRVSDRIDLYATDSRSGETTRVLANVTVMALSDADDDRLGSTGTQTITVATSDPDDIRRTIAAVRESELTVVRVSEARPITDQSGNVGDDETPDGQSSDGPADERPVDGTNESSDG